MNSADADLYEVGDYKPSAADDQRSLLPAEILDQYKTMTREVGRHTYHSAIDCMSLYRTQFMVQMHVLINFIKLAIKRLCTTV